MLEVLPRQADAASDHELTGSAGQEVNPDALQ
jgi:hypothetical protein